MCPQILSFQCSAGFVTLIRGGDRPRKDQVPSKPTIHLIWAFKYCRKVLVCLVQIRLLDVLKMIAGRHGYRLFAARVHDGDHVYLFVSARQVFVFLRLFVF